MVDDAAQHEDDEPVTAAVPGTGSLPAPPAASSVALASLVPRYEEEQHKTYLDRLEAAVKEPRNLNIALTGRYGTGKSSVLIKFEEPRKLTTLRMAISTLGPNDEGATLTNRIQKELVKQLVYSATPETLRHSRFRRNIALSWKRAMGETAIAVALLGTLLALMGWLPPVAGTGPDHHWAVRLVGWAAAAAVLVAVGTVIRRVTYDRYMISDVSAGGATVKLSERSPTYFDEYLDDIVNYFDTEDVDVVIFEDLDRFNDPHIFEALRELNTLLNNTKKREKKGIPLRFVYAVRDSLFEKLGADTKIEGDDAVVAETIRANRTKFFDIVIPMVPFISHRNARDLLNNLLDEAGITGLDRGLLSLVARHATDMRLLHNICNEYLVFAERLLESNEVAPGLTPSHLFALVAYKNFHLEDFENISRRASRLDRLYDFRRELVRDSIAALERRKRHLASGTEQLRTRAPLAHELGQRLHTAALLCKERTGHSQFPYLDYVIGTSEFTSEQLGSYEFWQAAAQAEAIEVLARHNRPNTQRQQVTVLRRSHLELLAPEGMNPERWFEFDEDATRAEQARIDRDIAFLRGADFSDLADANEYSLSLTLPAPPSSTNIAEDSQKEPVPQANQVDRTFAELIDDAMQSELARDLVKRGYLDRNFALYAAQFYGNFTGVDVANFMIQNVQTNMMEVDYQFTSPGAVANLLHETDDHFTHTIAAYNNDVLDYLLDADDSLAANVINRIVTNFDDDASTFLTSYFTSGSRRETLAARLANYPWHGVFRYLVSDDGIPADARPTLVNAALCAIDPNHEYDLPPEISGFIVDHYRGMPAFTQPQDQAVTDRAVTILSWSGVLVPDIAVLDRGLCALIVDGNHYEITAPNLRTALDLTNTGDVTDISLDQVRKDEAVYGYCLAYPRSYLAAVEQDEATRHTICSPNALSAALVDIAEEWEEGHLTDLLEQAAPECCLTSLDGVPTEAWIPLADTGLFRSSLSNLESYRTGIGSIDEHLAALLEDAGTIHTSDPGDAVNASGDPIDHNAAAIAILNASAISDPTTRVALVRGLDVDAPLPIADIAPDPSDLLARLLESNLVADNSGSFSHFHEAGWAAIGPAIATSNGITGFLTPGLVRGMVADVLNDQATSEKIGHQILEDVEEFVPEEDPAALDAVAQYAAKRSTPLTPETVVRIARAAVSNRNLVLRLLDAAAPAANAQHIVDVFTALGDPYDQVNQSGAQFTVSHDAIHRSLLTTLQKDNICTFRKKTGKDQFAVNIS